MCYKSWRTEIFWASRCFARGTVCLFPENTHSFSNQPSASLGGSPCLCACTSFPESQLPQRSYSVWLGLLESKQPEGEEIENSALLTQGSMLMLYRGVKRPKCLKRGFTAIQMWIYCKQCCTSWWRWETVPHKAKTDELQSMVVWSGGCWEGSSHKATGLWNGYKSENNGIGLILPSLLEFTVCWAHLNPSSWSRDVWGKPCVI